VIGTNVDPPSNIGSRQLNIGNLIYGTNVYDGTLAVQSSTPVSNGTIGIGTTTPWARFSVADAAGGTTPLFIISTSTSGFATSTALIVDQNGNVGIGTSSPTTALQVNGSITPNTDNVSTVGNATYRWNAVYATNNVIQTSDARLKENVNNLSYGLADILKLRPVSFTWIAQPQQGTKLGFIAQEVHPILPETVNVGDDANHTLGLTYTEFIPVIVKAVQDIANITSTFQQNLIAWLGNASNGITDLFAANGHFSNELCVGSACVTPQQFQAMVAAANQSANQSPSGAQPSHAASSSLLESVTQNSASTTPPTITINGDNSAIIQVGDSYGDLGAIAVDSVGNGLGLKYFLNGTLVSNIVIDTSEVATDTIDYVATDTYGNTATSTRTVVVESAPSTNATTAAATSTTQ
jgi:Chaperone of endosialidase/Domain of unknown function (DUF5011)